MRELKRQRAKFIMKARGMVGIFDTGKKHERNRFGTKKRKHRQKPSMNSPVSYFAKHWREFVEPVLG